MTKLTYHRGTLVARELPAKGVVARLTFDDRVDLYRCPAYQYRALVGEWTRLGIAFEDEARGYEELDLTFHGSAMWEHQADALKAFGEAGKRGVIVLPTGAGKTHLAQRVIEDIQRSTLVVVPTLDLVDQWRTRLAETFQTEIGQMGGGKHEVLPLTVSTYDSAAIHMEYLGGRFGLLIFDEVHHLPSALYRTIAEFSIAPFRLGLSATLTRPDGKHHDIFEIVGPVVFELGIKDLRGDVLAEYETQTVPIHMSEEDLERYEESRKIYRDFLEENRIRVGSQGGWQRFLRQTNQSAQGRAALLAWREQKRLALGHSKKIDHIAEILSRHPDERIIIFTNDNETVYKVSERYLRPALTHQTPADERAEILRNLSSGVYDCVVTSRVLNEGVDVPEASVAIILSGTSSVREHVQRLGRILRRSSQDKVAVLYELVTAETSETYSSQRRREHDAYR